MAKKTYTIQGKIVDHKYKQGIPGLKVVAWDKDLICDDFLDHKETDEQGRFRMEFSRAQFQEWFFDRKPDLFFKIYHKDEEIYSTRDNILWNYDNADEEKIIPIVWEFEERYLISGYVQTEDNRPVPNFKVIAFDRKVGEDRSLGESMTKNGIYKIDYTEKATELLQNQNADLIKTYRCISTAICIEACRTVGTGSRSTYTFYRISKFPGKRANRGSNR